MRIFVTGGTGYIGLALSRRLASAGHEVRCLVRPTSRTAALEDLGVSCCLGDITDRDSLYEGMEGCEWVVHAAAELDPAASRERMRAVNVAGSDNVAAAALRLGIPRFLSVSSMAWFGGSPTDGSAADESAPPRLPFPSLYSLTKHEGEAAIQRHARQGLCVNTVFPSLVYGPPGKTQGANALLRSILRRRFPAIVAGDRKTSWVFLDDLVAAIVCVLERAEPGRGYLLAGDVTTVETLVLEVCRLGGVEAPRWRLSAGAARLLSVASAPLYRLRGRRPPIAGDQVASLGRHWCFDDRRARRELDWRPRPLAEGLPPTIDHLLAME